MENISVFDIFKIGIGPSSSHTLGPWKAALSFIQNLPDRLDYIHADLFGSLSKTGRGHGTDIAVILGLQGFDPETIDVHLLHTYVDMVRTQRKLRIRNREPIVFNPDVDIAFRNETHPGHPNALTFRAFYKGKLLREETYFSVGGGFILRDGDAPKDARHHYPFPYSCGNEADIEACLDEHDLSISQMVWENEKSIRSPKEIRHGLRKIWDTMLQCMFRGCHTEGVLPGGLNVQRRAYAMHQKLLGGQLFDHVDEWVSAIRAANPSFSNVNKWVSCFALAVNEENAAFGRIVTAPTNGAAGVIPAVLMYAYCFHDQMKVTDVYRFLLTASEIGSLFKKGSTISAAVGGCQAEIGVSSAMAAAGLTEIMGGSPKQALMAAEIAMEHHLGLTCDPIGGLVQVPCIERNTMGAMKAITASNLALDGDADRAIVKLDKVIRTMWQTAQDMHSNYKETAEGGLAIQVPVIVPEC